MPTDYDEKCYVAFRSALFRPKIGAWQITKELRPVAEQFSAFEEVAF